MSSIKKGQEGLLLWLQARTTGYNGVNVTDFTRSWENGNKSIHGELLIIILSGLAFCALIHSFYPGVIPFDTLKPEDKAHLYFIFSVINYA